MSSTKVDPNEPITTDETRDTRFKEMLQQQFGESGVGLLVYQAFIFLMALIMIVGILIGLITTRGNEIGILKLAEPALVLKGQTAQPNQIIH